MEEEAEKFIKFVGENYKMLINSFTAFGESKMGGFDEDIFQDSILKVYDKIKRDGIEDVSETGMKNYLFKAYKQNFLREKDYARNRRNDDNIAQEQITELYENWAEKQNISTKEKLLKDLKVDFFALRMAEVVEENFDSEKFYLWRIKTFLNLTYKELARKTNIPSARNKVLEVQEFLRQNVKKEDLEKEFYEKFSDLIDY